MLESSADDSLGRDVAYVRTSLAAAGLDAPLPLLDAPWKSADDHAALAATVRGLVSLVSALDSARAFRRDAEARMARLEEEVAARQGALDRLMARASLLEGDVRAAAEEARVRAERLLEAERALRAEREECARVRGALAARERAYAAEARRTQRDADRMREQLQTLLRDGACASAAVENLVVSPVDSRLSDNYAPCDAGLSRADVLEHENANMRQLVASVCGVLGEMRAALSPQPAAAAEGDTADTSSVPVSWAYDGLKAEIESSLSAIADHLGL